MKNKVITLCGSIKYIDKMNELGEKLQLEGNIVFSVIKSNRTVPYTLEERNILGLVHKKKINLSDEIYIINVDGYIGGSTASEIEYAKSKNIKINYLVPINI